MLTRASHSVGPIAVARLYKPQAEPELDDLDTTVLVSLINIVIISSAVSFLVMLPTLYSFVQAIRRHNGVAGLGGAEEDQGAARDGPAEVELTNLTKTGHTERTPLATNEVTAAPST